MNSKVSDAILVSQVMLLDDRKAFATLVERYQARLRSFFVHVTAGDAMLADDLAQETFIKLYYGIRQFKGLAGFSTYLWRIAYNVFYDHMRAVKPHTQLDAAGELPASAPSDAHIDVAAALAILSPTERAAVTFYYLQDRPVNEVATTLSLPVGTVKSHLARARAKLFTFFNNNGYETQQ